MKNRRFLSMAAAMLMAMMGTSAMAQHEGPVLTDYFTEVSATQVSTPDDQGFIRRWMLLEPVGKPNRSNTPFVDSYLREHLNQEYFKDQKTIMPKNGQKVNVTYTVEEMPANFDYRNPTPPTIKTVKDKLAWHELESNRYNVKLFRFASGLDKTVYGVIFFAVTVIECDEDIENVRLAVGSNSGSLWWLNGEETLILSGDRRMVQDDCVSKRITLKKGRNVLRGAVINGPGMSDFCVRFIDEKGNPVKGYKVISTSAK